jgi:hypothetical protein
MLHYQVLLLCQNQLPAPPRQLLHLPLARHCHQQHLLLPAHPQHQDQLHQHLLLLSPARPPLLPLLQHLPLHVLRQQVLRHWVRYSVLQLPLPPVRLLLGELPPLLLLAVRQQLLLPLPLA